jgi:microcystin-dependent protein
MGFLSFLRSRRFPRPSQPAERRLRLRLEVLEDRTVLDNTLPAGGGQPVTISQPSLALHYIICVAGVFPTQDGGVVDNEPYLGEVILFAGNFAPEGWDFCDGQMLSIVENTSLFDLLGTTYGGDGISTFALPDLQGRAAVGVGEAPGLSTVELGQEFGTVSTTVSVAQEPQHAAPLAGGGSTGALGGGQPISIQNPSLGLNYIFALQGYFPTQDFDGENVPLIGEIRLFAGNFAPGGWALCDGQILPIDENTALFAILGTTYGGNGTTNFALPNLQGRNPVGAGQGAGLTDVVLGQEGGSDSVTLNVSQLPAHTYPLPPSGNQSTGSVGGGQTFGNEQPYLGLNYLITEEGVFPARDPEPMVGDIRLFAGTFAPDGFALCQGQVLSIDENTALFSILGTTYGGDGISTYALPNLEGRAAIGAGQGSGLPSYC